MIAWGLQLGITFLIAQFKAVGILLDHMVKQVPESVIEYTIYLFEKDKSESEVRAELTKKGWNKKEDQEAVFDAIGIIMGYNQAARE